MFRARVAPILGSMLIVAVASACGGGARATGSPAGGATTSPPAAVTSPPASPDETQTASPAETSPAASPDESPTESATGGAPADISGEMSATFKYKDNDDPIATVRVDQFTNAYPGVKVTFSESDFDAQAFLASVAAGTPDDAVRMDRNILGTYAAQGALEPLDECIARAGIDMGVFRESAVAQVTLDGKIYGIPEFFDTRSLLINNKAVQEAGLTPEDVDTSDWDALAEVNRKLLKKEGNDITRIGFDPKLPEFLPLWAHMNGVDILSPDGKTSNLEDPKVAEALQFTAGLINEHGDAATFFDFRNTGPGGVDFFGGENQFVANTVGAFGMEQWYLNVLADVSPQVEITYRPFEMRNSDEPVTLSGGSAWVIPAAADNKEAACEWAKVMTHEDTWYAAAKVRADARKAEGEPFTGVFTGNRNADERIFSELVTESGNTGFDEAVQTALEVQDSAFALPATAGAEAFDREWRAAVDRVLNEGADPAAALKEADEAAQQAIDEAGGGD